MRFVYCTVFLLLVVLPVQAQDPYDPSWYDPTRPHLKIAVTQDGVYRVTGQDLEAAGVPLSTVDATTFRLLENGQEVPLHYTGTAVPGSSDALVFIGQRNRGTGETWAYNDDAPRQSSSFFSLYTDTTWYWLTWGGNIGRRYVPHTATNPSSTPLATHRDTLHVEQDDLYYPGDVNSAGDPAYTRGEGYYWSQFRHTTTNTIERTFDAVLLNPTRNATDTLYLRVRLNSESNTRHQVVLNVRLLEGTAQFLPLDTLDWTGYALQTFAVAIPQQKLTNDNLLRIRLSSRNDFGTATPNFWSLDWIEVSYRRTLTAVNEQLGFGVDAQGTYDFTLTGFTDPLVLVLDPATATFETVPVADGQALVTRTANPGQRFLVTGTDHYLTPAALRLDTASDLANAANQAGYVVLTTPALRTSAEQMAAYRATVAGGSHRTLVVDVQDVFDQFDYGRPTPLALRRFLRTALGWAAPLQFLTLWGDALYPDRTRMRPVWEVPSFGNAASDGWFAMQNAGATDWSESAAVGRIPVRDNTAGAQFVQKLTAYEATAFEAWQKRALYLVGGFTTTEKNILQNLSLNWSNQVAVTPTGLDTLHFFKDSSLPLDPTFKDSLRVAFQEGASWLTYFGHSASSSWEIVTDPPNEFDNTPRLPIVLSLGCFTGDFAIGEGVSEDPASFSELLVVASLNGSIAHWGAAASGIISASSNLSNEVHDRVFADTVRVLGPALQQAKARFNETYKDGTSVKHLLQYGLIGDPATRINLPTRPDPTVTPASLRFDPITPIPADGQLTVTVTVDNYGLIPHDSVTVQLTHQPPTGTATIFTRRVAPFGLHADVAFDIPLDDASVGTNRFTVRLDPANALVEEQEANNTAEQTLTVFSTGLTLTTPTDFGLVETATPTLQVALATPEPAGTPVTIQLDTVPTFDSPAFRENRQTASGLVATWQPGPLQPGLLYYWRARIDTQGENWQTGAFTARPDLGLRGWYQQGDLFAANTQSSRLEYQDGAWRFKTFTVEVSASSERGSGIYKGEFLVNGDIFERLGLGFGLLVLDGRTGTVRASGSMPTYPNNFEDAAAAFRELDSLLTLAQPGDYLFTRTRHLARGSTTQIPDSVKALFRAVGSTAIDTLTYEHLWIMFTRKGFPQETVEFVEPPGTVNEILQETSRAFSFGDGQTLTPPIGPAKAWQTLGWQESLPTPDSNVRVEVLAGDGSTVLIPNLDTAGTTDLAALDARQHPYLHLRATLTDPSLLGVPQLTHWYVGYQAVPELALDPASLSLTADTLLEGQPLDIAATLRNLSPVVADTVLVEYRLTKASNETVLLHTERLLNVASEATTRYTLPTDGLTGSNLLTISISQPGLPEATVFNNVLIRPFVVFRDQTPPVFTVLVDGVAYPNDPNPVVNLQDPALPFFPSRPVVEITIEDENAFRPLQGDTTVVTVRLDGQEVPFSQLDPGTGKQADVVRFQFEPNLSGQDTTHTLLVSVQDGSGNEAADSPYQVHFRTQSELAVEGLYPYPNPMSTRTTFAFRLLGSDAGRVRDFRLRLYTLNGRLIREFDLVHDPSPLEGGALRIGWNKLSWDGRDADGELVATGVYLYKVFARGGGQALPVNSDRVEKVVVIR
jgi:hypothetical protein